MKLKSVFGIAMLAGFSVVAFAQGDGAWSEGKEDKRIQKLASEQLHKKELFHGVTAEVDDGIVTLAGDVNLYIDKVNAEKRVRKIKSVDGVRNHIQVEGEHVADAELRETLANKLRYDRVGYGIVYNSLTVAVENGTVTVGGKVRDYPDRDSAIAILQTTPGVKDVVDEIDVAPLSMMDDGLRVRLARAIYGHATLQKYALDPQAPIRIVVENGNVELAGMVLTEMDKQMADVQARSVAGSFSITNNLMVANKTNN